MVKTPIICKRLCIHHGGMLTIVPDAVRISTQEAGEELVGPGDVRCWSENTVTITRANGKRFTLAQVTEVSVIHCRKPKEQE